MDTLLLSATVSWEDVEKIKSVSEMHKDGIKDNRHKL